VLVPVPLYNAHRAQRLCIDPAPSAPSFISWRSRRDPDLDGEAAAAAEGFSPLHGAPGGLARRLGHARRPCRGRESLSRGACRLRPAESRQHAFCGSRPTVHPAMYLRAPVHTSNCDDCNALSLIGSPDGICMQHGEQNQHCFSQGIIYIIMFSVVA